MSQEKSASQKRFGYLIARAHRAKHDKQLSVLTKIAAIAEIAEGYRVDGFEGQNPLVEFLRAFQKDLGDDVLVNKSVTTDDAWRLLNIVHDIMSEMGIANSRHQKKSRPKKPQDKQKPRPQKKAEAAPPPPSRVRDDRYGRRRRRRRTEPPSSPSRSAPSALPAHVPGAERQHVRRAPTYRPSWSE